MAFLLGKVDSAEIVSELEFPPMEEYPMPGDYESLYASDFRLSAIQYKSFSDFYSLSGIKLDFSNGAQTPLFKAEAAFWDELNTVEIDP